MNWFWYYDIVDRKFFKILEEPPEEPYIAAPSRATALGMLYLALIPMSVMLPVIVVMEAIFDPPDSLHVPLTLIFIGLTWVYLFLCYVVKKKA
ncbi:MAG: hypothetical protein AAGF53_15675 [Pseudomonadota bacterium]